MFFILTNLSIQSDFKIILLQVKILTKMVPKSLLFGFQLNTITGLTNLPHLALKRISPFFCKLF